MRQGGAGSNIVTLNENKKSETIFALSTCYGKSALGVIRVSGPEAYNCLSVFCIKQKIHHRQSTLVKIYGENNTFIDECLSLRFFKLIKLCKTKSILSCSHFLTNELNFCL